MASEKAPRRKPEFIDWKGLPQPVVGVDEVGRGCLAGPVYAAAVILPPGFTVPGVTDSKVLSEKRREDLAKIIYACAQVSVAFATVEEIAELNILHASLLAMRRAVNGLHVVEATVCVDGHLPIPRLRKSLQQMPIVEGDLRCTPVSAASIVAKVARDQMMKELDGKFPAYRFASNKGYGSSQHLEALQAHGPCPFHRRQFRGVTEHWHRLEEACVL